MISGYLVGDKEFLARLSSVPGRVRAEVFPTVQKLGFALQQRVQTAKLTGQVLNVRTGRLRSSIAQGAPDSRSRFVATGDTAIAYVGTNVSYGVAWEKGIRAHDVFPVRAKALRFTVGGETIFRMRAHIPAQAPRKFLEPALEEMRPLIIRELGAALRRGMLAALRT